jgi:5-methylcytosine-specific restriction endonuclease McrA
MKRQEYYVIGYQIFKRDGFKCRNCLEPEPLELHHIIPRWEGGLEEPDNLITYCKKCHRSKEPRDQYSSYRRYEKSLKK